MHMIRTEIKLQRPPKRRTLPSVANAAICHFRAVSSLEKQPAIIVVNPSELKMVYVGTSGWAYGSWKPKFYPAALPASRFLSFYASQLNAVEVNYTFCGRHSLRKQVADRWLAETPQDFVFTFRGPKPITHFYRHRLRHAEANVRTFQAALRPFLQANRLGPILFQLPKTFLVNTSVLDEFLSGWPRDLRVSFEFRHSSWFRDEVYEILRRHRAALSLTEADEISTPEILTAEFVYLRLRKSQYSASALEKLRTRVETYSEGKDVFAFFRQHDVKGPLYARGLARRIEFAKAA